MNLDPQTTERLIGMVSSQDKENRILAYGILMEYFTHIMFSFKRNIGYLMLIHKHMPMDDDDNQKKFISIMSGHAPETDYQNWYSYSTIIDYVTVNVKQSDTDQRRMVYEYAARSMRQKLQINV